MFAVLGDIIFEVVSSPAGFEARRRYDYAEHPLIEAKPRLQWLGNGLERLRLEIRLHASIGNPALQIALLKSAAAIHRPLPLVFGDGAFRGLFVIESIAARSETLSAIGSPIALTVDLELIESVPEVSPAGPPLPPFPPIGVLLPNPIEAAELLSGISALLELPAPTGPSSPSLQASDVPPGAIVRSSPR